MKRPRIDVNLGELDQLLDQAQQAPLSEPDCNKIKTTLHTLVELLIAKRHTEKTSAVVGPAGGDAAAESSDSAEKQTNGHGRNPASAYAGATRVVVPHPSLKHGDACPECPKGKVYAQKEPRPLVRIVGQAPLGATVYDLEQMRCNACGQVFTAPEPEGVGPEKYDETAMAMIAELKYGSGVPFHRIENLEKRLGVPLPSATQWEIVEEAAVLLQPVQEELIREAAQGELFHNDDTSVRILKMERPAGEERTGVFTSAVVSVVREASPEGARERRMALYFSGCSPLSSRHFQGLSGCWHRGFPSRRQRPARDYTSLQVGEHFRCPHRGGLEQGARSIARRRDAQATRAAFYLDLHRAQRG